MFEEVIDLLMVQYYGLYEQHKDAIENDDEFNKSPERKKMNKLIEPIAILWQNKTGGR